MNDCLEADVAHMRFLHLYGFLALLAASLAPVFDVSAASLLPHRALYDVDLLRADADTTLAGVKGRIVFEFKGSSCEGYTVSDRFVTRITDMDGQTVMDDSSANTFEAGDASRFEFSSSSHTNDELMGESRGYARRDGESVSVELTKPETQTLHFPPQTVFPTQQYIDILQRAEAGEKLTQHFVYDGVYDGARQVFESTTLIGPREAVAKSAQEGVLSHEALEKSPFWRITISYFDAAAAGDPTPQYVVSFDMHDNGVSRNIVMDYGNYALKAELRELEVFEPSPCE